jgi:amidase
MNFFLACAGPLANDMDALKIFTKAVLDAQPARLDSTALDVPWRDVGSLAKAKLKLGMVTEDPCYPLHPPVRRALNEAVRLLEAEGHEIVRLGPSESLIAEATEVALAFFATKSGGPDLIEEGGEPAMNTVVLTRKVMSELTSKFLKDIDSLQGVEKLAALNVKWAAVVDAWRETWNKYNFDAVLSPAAQNTAVPHDQYGIPPYTVFLNTLDVNIDLRLQALVANFLRLVPCVPYSFHEIFKGA